MKRMFIWLIALMFLGSGFAYAGDYTDSAHGNTVAGATVGYGVNRSSTSQYEEGHCGHCHEQHASIDGGTPPDPTPNTGDAAGPDKFCLLAQNFDTTVTTGIYAQDDNACFYCHSTTGSLQTNGITNNNFSATFSGDSTPFASGIMQAFNKTGYHNLYDVYKFITGAVGTNTFTNFPAGSNPCSGCHNIHIAKRNKADVDDPNDTAISKPSTHTALWGDAGTEILSNYTASYQAPHYTSGTNYEPDGTGSVPGSGWGSNMPDYNTFCIDCHTSTVDSVWSTTLNRWLKPINWTTEKHGKGNADTYITVDSPYTSGSGSLGYVLSCMDCHEPHGSPNAFLIRDYVNGVALGGVIAYGTDTDKLNNANWHYLCNRCHQDDIELRPSACKADQYAVIHHENIAGVNEDPFRPSPGSCGTGGCHSPAFTPKTNVLMPDRTCKPIGEIKTGDKILSFDFDNNAPRESEVVGTSNHIVSETIEINGVKTTPEQLFAVGRDRWVRADQLKEGDTVLGLAGDTGDLEKIKLEKPVYSKHPKGVEVAEITVKDTQNFFVIGKGESKFLVHNPPYSCTYTGYKKVCTDCHYHGSTYSTWRTF